MIVKKSDGYYVMSKRTHKDSKSGKTVHKNLGGPYKTRDEALKRLRQIEFFKHQG